MIAVLHVHFDLLAYPVREFPKATDIGFTMPYMVYPIMAGIYIMYEPRNSLGLRTLYLFVCSFGVGVFHHMMQKYTDLLDFVNYHWIFTFGFLFRREPFFLMPMQSITFKQILEYIECIHYNNQTNIRMSR